MNGDGVGGVSLERLLPVADLGYGCACSLKNFQSFKLSKLRVGHKNQVISSSICMEMQEMI